MERNSKYQKAKFFFKLNRLDLKILIGITEVPLNIGGERGGGNGQDRFIIGLSMIGQFGCRCRKMVSVLYVPCRLIGKTVAFLFFFFIYIISTEFEEKKEEEKEDVVMVTLEENFMNCFC